MFLSFNSIAFNKICSGRLEVELDGDLICFQKNLDGFF